jgi:hypothetical protein
MILMRNLFERKLRVKMENYWTFGERKIEWGNLETIRRYFKRISMICAREWEREKGKTHEGSEWWENALWPKPKSFFNPHRMCFSSFCRLWWAVLNVERTRVHSIAHLIARHRVRRHHRIKNNLHNLAHTRGKKAGKIENISSPLSSLMLLLLLLIHVVVPALLSVLTHDLFIGEFSRVYTSNRSRVEVHSAQFLLLAYFYVPRHKERERERKFTHMQA